MGMLQRLNFFMFLYVTVAYPELVSRGVSKTRKFKWLVKVGVYQTPDFKKILAGWGGFWKTKKNLDTPLRYRMIN